MKNFVSSIEPADVTERLMDTFCSNPNIMPHIHLSIQSGSDSILKKMCRQYRLEDVYKSVELLNGRLDRPAITCDLIVGFPGETDMDFEKTVELAKDVKFAKMHIFSFSPRKGTSAYEMKPNVPMRIIKERSQILRSLDKQLRFQFRQQFLGQQQVILTESCDGDRQAGLSGRTERYFVVRLQSHCKGVGENQLVKVELTENKEDGMLGRFVRLV
jgi:threonylcarbamoyladenosine tRNA methylthiotransferase MtaB